MSLHNLLVALADNQAHHITELAHLTQRQPHQLNALWQQTPPHIRGLLRQKDGFWRLIRPLALLPETHQIPNFHTRILRETGSTNDDLLLAAKNGENIHRQLLIAHQQNAGRGRQGKIWESRIGECLMFSLGYTFDLTQSQLSSLALISALACQMALNELGCPAQIKWPNDLVIGLDKLGGILVETVRRHNQTHVVIGIGINFVLPKNVQAATSIQAACEAKISPISLLEHILHHLDQALHNFSQQGFIPFQKAYEAAHRDHHQEVFLLNDDKIVEQGKIIGIANNGALRLLTATGEQLFFSGQTSLRLPKQLHTTSANQPKRYLLLDGGNSRLKWAWAENGEIIASNQAPYRDLSQLAKEWQHFGQDISKIVGTAVCGPAKQAMIAAQLPHIHIEWLSSMKRAIGIYNHYQNPSEHGADRWFNVLGSRRFSQNACVIVSCGTAVTIDALTADNHYLGGTIMPGFHLMKESLALKTANLNRPIGKVFPFPTTTANALASGMMDAVCGSLILMHSRLQTRHENKPTDIIITGGGAAKVVKSLPDQFTLDNSVKIVDNLVVFGLLNWLANSDSISSNTYATAYSYKPISPSSAEVITEKEY